jgi:hypothetical protein
MDRHERIVPDIMEWELTGFDVNKDVRVSDWFQCTGLKIQIKHLDHIFRIYIKSMGRDTICRVEESLNPMKSAVQAINEILPNPNQREQQELCNYDNSSRIHDMVKSLLELHKHKRDSTIGEEEPLVLERGGS